ncbi:MAG: hypothetical protein ACOYZ7_19835 [Chloroflexota bacterium]
MKSHSFHRVKAFFLVTAIPFGLVAGLSFRSYLKYDWLLILVCDVLLGAVYGLIMTGVAYLFSRFIEPSGCARIMLIGLMGIVGFLSGGVLGIGSSAWIGDRLPTGDWKRIGYLPEKPVAVLAEFEGVVYVRAQEGGTYACRYPPFLLIEDPQPCSKENPDSEELARIRRMVGADLIDPPVPPVPGKVILSYEVEHGVEVIFQYNYVFLEDGSLWVWQGVGWFFGAYHEPVYGAMIGGLLIGLTASLLAIRKWQVPAPPTTAPGGR